MADETGVGLPRLAKALAQNHIVRTRDPVKDSL